MPKTAKTGAGGGIVKLDVPGEEWLRITDAVELTGYVRQSLEQLAASGRLRRIKVVESDGKHLRSYINRSDAEALARLRPPRGGA